MKNPPLITLEYLGEPEVDRPFIKTVRGLYNLYYPDGSTAETVLETIERKAPDASVIIPIDKKNGEDAIWLRSSFRPGAGVRSAKDHLFEHTGNLWELPAGLIDPGESPVEAAKRECFEEVGFDAPLIEFSHLLTVLSMPSILAEELFFYTVRVDELEQQKPPLDGSPLEKGGELICVPLTEIEKELNKGKIPDIKTHLGLRELLYMLGT